MDVLAVREVALCVKYGHFGAQTLYRDAIDQQNLYIKKVMAFLPCPPPTSIFMQEYPEGVRNQGFGV